MEKKNFRGTVSARQSPRRGKNRHGRLLNEKEGWSIRSKKNTQEKKKRSHSEGESTSYGKGTAKPLLFREGNRGGIDVAGGAGTRGAAEF